MNNYEKSALKICKNCGNKMEKMIHIVRIVVQKTTNLCTNVFGFG